MDALGPLVGAAIAALAGARGGPELLAEYSGAIAGALGDPGGGSEHALFLGTYADAPVGVALALAGTLGDQRIGRLLLCYVEPDAREVGVGRALLDAVTTWACQTGCAALEAPALPGDRATKRLLEAGGHRARQVVMNRRLGPG